MGIPCRPDAHFLDVLPKIKRNMSPTYDFLGQRERERERERGQRDSAACVTHMNPTGVLQGIDRETLQLALNT